MCNKGKSKNNPTLGKCPVTGKIRFKDKKQADEWILLNNYNLRSYHCEHKECGYHHVTSQRSNCKFKLAAPAAKVRRRNKPRRLL